jgi:hypothetical protein
MPFNQVITSNTEFFGNYEDFHFQPEPDTESPIVEPDPFSDCQIDVMVEGIEMRSARSFDSAVEAGAAPTRRPKCSLPTHDTHGSPRRRYPRPMPSLLLAILAVFGLLVTLLISNETRRPALSVKIKPATSTTPTYQTIEQPPPPTRRARIRSVKMPR